MADEKSEGAESASAHPDKLTTREAAGYGAALVGLLAGAVLLGFFGEGLKQVFGHATAERVTDTTMLLLVGLGCGALFRHHREKRERQLLRAENAALKAEVTRLKSESQVDGDA